jgi:hypothetical protein
MKICKLNVLIISGNGAVAKEKSVRSKKKPAKDEKTPTLHISDEG